MEDAAKELLRASKNGVTFTVLHLLDQGTDPNVADEVVIQKTVFLLKSLPNIYYSFI